jgi:hypothetical protein
VISGYRRHRLHPTRPRRWPGDQLARFDVLLTDLKHAVDQRSRSAARWLNERDPDLSGVIMTGDGSIASAVESMKQRRRWTTCSSRSR